MNQTNATLAVRLVGASSFVLMAATATTVNILLLASFIRGRSYLHSAFFVIAWSMLIGNFVALVPQFLLVIPETVAGRRLYSQSVVYFLAAFDTFGYNANLMTAMLLSVNRVCIFLLPRVDKALFQLPRIYLMIAMPWLYSLWLTVSLNTVDCPKDFSTDGYYLYYDCDPGSSVYIDVYNFTVVYIPLAMIVFYAITYVEVKISSGFDWRRQLCCCLFGNCRTMSMGAASHTSPHISKRELKFFLQSFIICGVLQLENWFFAYVPSLPMEGEWEFALDFFSGCMVLLFFCIDSIVILCFNARIRGEAKCIIRCESADARKNIIANAKTVGVTRAAATMTIIR